MTTLHTDQYTSFIAPSLGTTTFAAVFCIVVHTILTLMPLRRGALTAAGVTRDINQSCTGAGSVVAPTALPAAQTVASAKSSIGVDAAARAECVLEVAEAQHQDVSKSGSWYERADAAVEGNKNHYSTLCLGGKNSNRFGVKSVQADNECTDDWDGTLRVVLLSLLILMLLLVVTLWTILISTHHRDAVDDLMLQLANSTDTMLEASLVSARTMVKQATNIWQFTGAPVTALTSVSVWQVPILEGFQSSTSLRFATTAGLEQTTLKMNGSIPEIRVLSREFYGGSNDVCLKEYLSDGVTAGTTPDNCLYDPRFSKWFQAGRRSTLSGSDYAFLVEELYMMGTNSGTDWGTGVLGLGYVTKCVRGGFAGVWAGEFTLDSVGEYLAQLKDNLHGTILVASADPTGAQDGYLIASSSASVKSIVPCLTTPDYFVSSAAKMITAEYSNFSSAAEKVLRDKTVVKTQRSSISSGLLNVISLARGQLYSKVDRMCDIMFTFALVGVSAFLWLAHLQHKHRESRIVDFEASAQRDLGIESIAETDRGNPESELISIYDQIVQLVQPQVTMLEWSVRNDIEKNGVVDVEAAVTKKMRALATEFLKDSNAGRDASTHIKLLMMPYTVCHHLWIWTQFGLHSTLFNAAAISGVILELFCEGQDWDQSTLYVIQCVIVMALGIDVWIHAALQFTSTRPVIHGSKHTFQAGTLNSIFLVPTLWLLLSVCTLSSKYYYCDSQPCIWKHYL